MSRKMSQATLEPKENVQRLATEIRRCNKCQPTATPCVYAPSNPSVLVVSEGPSKTAWPTVGEKWRNGTIFDSHTSKTLYEWIWSRTDPEAQEAKKTVFWIHRRNCFIEGESQTETIQRCSECGYIEKAIECVDPKLLIALGATAARHFFKFKKLEEVVGKTTYKDRDCYVLYHPSARNRRYHNETRHLRTLQQLREALGIRRQTQEDRSNTKNAGVVDNRS